MKEKILLLYSAMCDKRTPWYVKAMVGLVLAYIISPIDIIPDFIPVIGLLDEAVLVPIALVVIFKLIPESVKQDELSQDIDETQKRNLMLVGALLILSVWVTLITIVIILMK
jgi:uncharacterized membrane protein YkvA (DUF1232 family)